MSSADDRPRVILLPGGVLPAEAAYGELLPALGPDVDALPKELELYSGDQPPAEFGLDDEVEGVLRAAGARRFECFNLVGYSAGGAVALAFAAHYPGRLLSLALLEPAWAGNEGLSSEEQAAWSRFEPIMRLPPPQRLEEFVRVQLRPGVAPPPPAPGPSPPWMARRPAGLEALTRAFDEYDLDMEALQAFDRPVYYALGALSNPDLYRRRADRLARVFSDFTLEIYEERHHFDPPHRTEPERLARSLRQVWSRHASRPREG